MGMGLMPGIPPQLLGIVFPPQTMQEGTWVASRFKKTQRTIDICHIHQTVSLLRNQLSRWSSSSHLWMLMKKTFRPDFNQPYQTHEFSWGMVFLPKPLRKGPPLLLISWFITPADYRYIQKKTNRSPSYTPTEPFYVFYFPVVRIPRYCKPT